MKIYTPEQELMLVKFYKSLDESSQRRYAAIEVFKFGDGG
ncbi:MAG: Unknown protein [uncultured Sulfurovum sp.]|uniref:Uncharacterized protein n=1 Tax=uncultured Sulfurovum sp. TaxID=269237 RepID=A0A6S6TU79_9BACT|nr:MAG: Unknown protein [uncultured Sulfurovum sp.]